MSYFDFKRRNLTSGPHLLGVLLVTAGLFALVSPFIFGQIVQAAKAVGVGGGAIAIGILIICSYEGVCLDFNKNAFRYYSSICGFKRGEWAILPDIKEVRLISTSYESTNTPNGISPTLTGKVTEYKILLYTQEEKPLFTFEYRKRNEAIKIAESLAVKLKARLLLNLTD